MAGNTLAVRSKISEIESLHVKESEREIVRLWKDSVSMRAETLLKFAAIACVVTVSIVETVTFAAALATILSVIAVTLGAFVVVGGIALGIGTLAALGIEDTVSEKYRKSVEGHLGISRYRHGTEEIVIKSPQYRDRWNPIRLVKPMVLGQKCSSNGNNGSYTITTVKGSAFHTSVTKTTHLTDRGLFNEMVKKLESNRMSGK